MKKMIFFSTQKGFTLIEVLVSVTLLGIISVSILSFFNQSYDYTKNNQSKTVGINVARNVVNYIEQQDFKHINDIKTLNPIDCKKITTGTNGSLKNCENFLTTTINNITYTSSIKLGTYDASSTADKEQLGFLEKNLIPISVTVTWNDRSTTVRGIMKNEKASFEK